MAVNKVVYAGKTLVDLTGDTVTPNALAQGVTAHDASGEEITGTMPTTTVLYTNQSLTNAQKEQARKNINAVSANNPALNYSIEKAEVNMDSVVVVEDTAASTSASDNSMYFAADNLVVNKDTYKLDTERMLSLVDKKMTGDGSVAWNEWDDTLATPSFHPEMLSSTLKVRYSDDPIYMSMKLPPEAIHPDDWVKHAGMRPSDEGLNSTAFVHLNSLGAVIPLDYTQLPNEVVICIGRMAVYTLSKDENARWELFDFAERPMPNAAMYYYPWSGNNDQHTAIDSGKIEEREGYTRYRLNKSDFAPSSSTSSCKVLHFWGNDNKTIDFSNNLACIELFEIWTETNGAAELLYTASGLDRKTADNKTISQNLWGRNVLLRNDKIIVAGHNISDALYDKLRDTGNDPRRIYDDYVEGKTWGYEIDQMQETIERVGAVADEIEQNTMRSTACFEMLEETEMLKPGININPGVYVYGCLDTDKKDGSVTIPSWAPRIGFINADYVPVTGGRKITVYYDAAEWNKNNLGIDALIQEYDANKNIIVPFAYVDTYHASKAGYQLNANTAYIKISYSKYSGNITTALADIKMAIYYLEDARLEFVEYGVGGKYAYGLTGSNVVLTAPNGTKYRLAVTNEGALTVTSIGG